METEFAKRQNNPLIEKVTDKGRSFGIILNVRRLQDLSVAAKIGAKS
jgi:hypothetical protein